jgi:hypothetical protein
MPDERRTEDLIKAGLRTLAASVPGAASLVQMWNEYETIRQSERVGLFFEQFRSELERAGGRIEALQARQDQSYEQLPEIIEMAILYARRTASHAKARALARAAVQAITSDDAEKIDDCYAELEALDTLTERDIGVLRYFAAPEPRRFTDVVEAWPDDALRRSDTPHRWAMRLIAAGRPTDPLKLWASVCKLTSRGLLEDCTPVPPVDYGVLYEHESADPSWYSAHFRVTSFGRRLIERLRDDAFE